LPRAERVFSVLNVRSVAAEDLSGRARIRDAAVRLFAREGFGVPVRAVAADAGVSPALVIHHFGSKDALREECDAHVLRTVRELGTRSLLGGPAEMLAELAAVDDYAPLAGYLVQALLAGGPLATALLDAMAADAEVYLDQAVAAGRLRSSHDPAARARFLVAIEVGALLVHLRWHPVEGGDLGAALRAYAETATLPALELYTEGLLADSAVLDAYLATRTQRGQP
jgi:TetR/AcrR family transcriptional regulator, regulator of cefoperazone and chloramphenicol sensitivity